MASEEIVAPDPETEVDFHRLTVLPGGRGLVFTPHTKNPATGAWIDYDATPIARALDATGAGDVFFATWLVSRYHRGEPVERACTVASQLAAAQVAGEFISARSLALDRTA